MAAGDTADSAPEGDPTETALGLIGYPGQLRGQTVHAGIRTGVFEHLAAGERTGKEIADDLDLNPDYTQRLLRALAVYGLLAANAAGQYTLTPVGERFLTDHPESVRDVALFFYHPARYAAVRHLPKIVAVGDLLPKGGERIRTDRDDDELRTVGIDPADNVTGVEEPPA